MSELTESRIKSLKVAELRRELSSRGLPVSGTKPVLVNRLLEFIHSEEAQEGTEQTHGENPAGLIENESASVSKVELGGTSQKLPVRDGAEDSTPANANIDLQETIGDGQLPSVEGDVIGGAGAQADPPTEVDASAVSVADEADCGSLACASPVPKEEETAQPMESSESSEDAKATIDTNATVVTDSPVEHGIACDVAHMTPPAPAADDMVAEDLGTEEKQSSESMTVSGAPVSSCIEMKEKEGSCVENNPEPVEIKTDTLSHSTALDTPAADSEMGSAPSGFGAGPDEVKKEAVEERSDNPTTSADSVRSDSPAVAVKQESQSLPGTVAGPRVVLDEYNSDLHFCVQPSGLIGASRSGCPGFAHMWAGARGSHGALGGKVCFEARIVGQISVVMDDTPESLQHLARFGWSVPSLDYVLGEAAHSYGFGGSGKASVNNNYKDYGESFSKGDTITCYLDLESSPHTISYAKNGKHLGVAFSFDGLEESVLFPHVLLKNVEVSVNFGANPPQYPLEEGYVFLQDAAPSLLKEGPQKPESFEACKVLMMVGLPAAGKTTWAKKHQETCPDERFTILGTNTIMDQMRVHNLLRKRNYHGRFEQLMDAATKVHNRLLDVAKTKRRNYILDQTNVYPGARRRKISNFSRFGVRQAVIVVIPQSELESRAAKRQAQEGKLVPDHAVIEMRRNFVLPELKDGFTSLLFTEEQEESARSLVLNDKKEAWAMPLNKPSGDHTAEPPAKRPFTEQRSPQSSPSLLGDYKQPAHDSSHGGSQQGRPGNDASGERRPLLNQPPHPHRSQSYGGGRYDPSHRTDFGRNPRPFNSRHEDGSQRNAPEGRGRFSRWEPRNNDSPNRRQPLMGNAPPSDRQHGYSHSGDRHPSGGHRGGHAAHGRKDRWSDNPNRHGGGFDNRYGNQGPAGPSSAPGWNRHGQHNSGYQQPYDQGPSASQFHGNTRPVDNTAGARQGTYAASPAASSYGTSQQQQASGYGQNNSTYGSAGQGSYSQQQTAAYSGGQYGSSNPSAAAAATSNSSTQAAPQNSTQYGNQYKAPTSGHNMQGAAPASANTYSYGQSNASYNQSAPAGAYGATGYSQQHQGTVGTSTQNTQQAQTGYAAPGYSNYSGSATNTNLAQSTGAAGGSASYGQYPNQYASQGQGGQQAYQQQQQYSQQLQHQPQQYQSQQQQQQQSYYGGHGY